MGLAKAIKSFSRTLFRARRGDRHAIKELMFAFRYADHRHQGALIPLQTPDHLPCKTTLQPLGDEDND